MTLQEVHSMVAGFGLPYAYYQFPRDTGRRPPFLCFYYGASDDFYADDYNYQSIANLTIELYTGNKDFVREEAIERELKRRRLPYEKEQTYIDSQRLYITSYEMEIVMTPTPEEGEKHA